MSLCSDFGFEVHVGAGSQTRPPGNTRCPTVRLRAIERVVGERGPYSLLICFSNFDSRFGRFASHPYRSLKSAGETRSKSAPAQLFWFTHMTRASMWIGLATDGS